MRSEDDKTYQGLVGSAAANESGNRTANLLSSFSDALRAATAFEQLL